MSLTRRTLLGAAAVAPALLSWKTSAAESDLDDAVRTYDQATVHNDVAALAQLVCDDYVLVNSDSTLQDKRSYLEDFKVHHTRLLRIAHVWTKLEGRWRLAYTQLTRVPQ